VVVVDPLTYRPLSPTLDESVQAAYMQETDILQAELNIRVQMEALEYAKSGWYPQVNAVLQDLYGRPDPHNSFNNTSANSWNVGVQLVYPLFQGFSTAAQVKQARLGVDQAEIQLRDTEENVLLNLKQAMYNLEDAAKSIQAQQANVEQAEEALRLVELGYRQGVRKQVEVLDAQRAVTTAQASYAQALYSHETARLQYEQATGALSAPDGRFTAPFGVHSSPIRQLLDSDDNPASGTTKQAR
jgi:outer membrane protein